MAWETILNNSFTDVIINPNIKDGNTKWEKVNDDITNGKIDIEKIKHEGVSLRIGNQLVNFTFSSEKDLTPADEVVKDLQDKFDKQVADVKENFEKQKSQLKFIHDKKVKELEKLRDDLKDKLNDINIMPDITYDHFRRGLTICKDGPNMVWLYRCEYKARYLNNYLIKEDFVKKKLTKPVIVELKTNQNSVVSLKVLNIDGSKFVHYHSFSNRDDCWGNWKFNSKRIETPDDAIILCDEAINVLSVINELSIANRAPRGLPRLPTIRKYLADATAVNEDGEVIRQRNVRNVWNINQY